MLLEEIVASKLKLQKKTIAIAESCTGGLLSHRLTNIPGSSRYLKFGLIAYSYDAKTKFLKVSKATLKKFGAVSQPVALSMAGEVRKVLNTDFGIGITGIAGPGGGTKTKSIGLTYIAVCSRNKAAISRSVFTGNRLSIKTKATTKALKMLLEFLQ